MYPLKNFKTLSKGYKFGQKTYYNDFHIGLDLIVPMGTPVYMPFDGTVKNYVGKEVGNCAEVSCRGLVMRFCHLSKFGAVGAVKKSALIGYSGNTGLSSGPHVHIDISKGKIDLKNHANFIDPLTFDWEADVTEEQLKRLDYLEGMRKGVINEGFYQTPDGTIHELIAFPAIDYAQEFGFKGEFKRVDKIEI